MTHHRNNRHATHQPRAIILQIAQDSIAHDLNLQPGDQVAAVNGQPIRDVIDYRFAIADDVIELLVYTQEGLIAYEIEKEPDEDVGITFTDVLFDRVRVCANNCLFCFVRQLPRGMRQSLYLKDDCYRLSFLYGNFITLTNLTEADWARIIEQHLSPLYVSVHATDPTIRATLLGRRSVPDIVAQLHRLGEHAIHVHTQIVLCPGINDGDVLANTINTLATLYPTVQSIAVVPVGLTQYYHHTAHHGSHLIQRYTADMAASVLDHIESVACVYKRRYGVYLVYPADEFFLLQGIAVPPASRYDGYPQYFNGIGITRDFLDAWQQAMPQLPVMLPVAACVVLVCGTLIASVMHTVVSRLNDIHHMHVVLLPVVNTFFGDGVTVSGLLTGGDVVTSLQTYANNQPCNYALLPRAMFDYTGKQTLDNYTLQRIEQETGLTIIIADTPDDLVSFTHTLATTTITTT